MSEPQQIKEILPGVMQNIRSRVKRQRRKRIIETTGEFLSGKVGRAKEPLKKAVSNQKELG